MSLRVTLIQTLALANLLMGCSPATTVTQTAWSDSPDRQWLTRIVRYDTVGPGINGRYEVVKLLRRSTNKTVEILALDERKLTHQQLNGPPIILLHWDNPNRLEIRYRDGSVARPIAKVAELSVEIRRSAVLQ